MVPFSAAPHHDVLGLLLQIATLLVVARAFGEIARRLGQPSVVGELLAGIVLGPSLLGAFVPFVDTWLIPDPGPQGYMLEVVGMMGAMFLLLITGMETDLALLKRHSRAAAGTSLGGIALPFATGFLLGQMLPDSLLGESSQRVVFSLFLATALSISAIPVIAKVLMDMDLMRRDVGQTIIAAGMTDDAIGWVILSIVTGLAAGAGFTGFDVVLAVGRVIGFLFVSFTLGGWLVRRLFDYVRDRVKSPFASLSLVIALTIAWGAIALALELEAVFGAFIMGILLGRLRQLPESVHDQVGAIAFGIFTPIFFAIAGLKVNARALADPTLLLIALLVLAVATFGKVAGGYLGGRYIGGRDRWTSLAFGIGMNARGAMGIIIATIGLDLAIISQDMFSVIVLMAIGTSLMAPPGLRWALRHVEPEQQELDRLHREALARGSRVTRIRRVLLPMRSRAPHDVVLSLEAAIMDRLARVAPVQVTLFNVAASGGRAQAIDFLDKLLPRYTRANPTRKAVEGVAMDEIIEEARKGYDLLVLGAPQHTPGADDAVFHPLVDGLVRLAPCPSVVVKHAGASDWPPRCILVPSNGSNASREAAELAYRIAEPDELVVLLNVIRTGDDDAVFFGTDAAQNRQRRAGSQIVSELRELGLAQGIRPLPLVRRGRDTERVILDVAREMDAGLIVLGTEVRSGAGRLFLGPRVERILDLAECPVLVYNATS